MGELILLRGEVAVALDTVEKAETSLVDIELLGILQFIELLGIVEIGLDLVRVQLPCSCSHGTLDITSSVVRLFAVSCTCHNVTVLGWSTGAVRKCARLTSFSVQSLLERRLSDGGGDIKKLGR